MKWLNKIRYRYRIFGSFAFLFFILISLGLYSTYGIQKISNSFQSMYEDRLVPSMSISMVLTDVYENRVSLDNHIIETNPLERQRIERLIIENHNDINEKIKEVYKTYLVAEEKNQLKEFRDGFNNYMQIELDILSLSNLGERDSALQLMTHKGNVVFHQIIRPLIALEKTQKEVGHSLYKESLKTAGRIKGVSYSVMIMAALTGIFLALALTYTNIDN